jgi:hypothetical protein
MRLKFITYASNSHDNLSFGQVSGALVSAHLFDIWVKLSHVRITLLQISGRYIPFTVVTCVIGLGPVFTGM